MYAAKETLETATSGEVVFQEERKTLSEVFGHARYLTVTASLTNPVERCGRGRI